MTKPKQTGRRMKRKISRLLAIAIPGLFMVVSFQNCSPEHMMGSNISASSGTGGGGGGLTPEEFQILQTKALGVLSTHCGSCHGGPSPTVPDVGNVSEMMFFITKGQPQNSALYLDIVDGVMPPGGSRALIDNPTQLGLIRDWIANIK